MIENMGQKIKERRLSLQMTLADLGTKVGVGASTVRKWETGYIKDMRSDKIQKVADALGVTPSYLMGWDESQNVNIDSVHSNNGIIGQSNAPVTINGNAPITLSKEEAEILRIYKELGVKHRIKLLTTALDLETEERSE
jgi:transcriptional regulator with XRE-family HTH domain